MRRFAAILVFVFSLSGLKAQEPEYMFEIGAGCGMSWTYGSINKSKALYNPSTAADLLLRYNPNPRWSFVGDISTCGIQGDSRDFDNALPNDRHLAFDNRIWQIAIRPEFHFWNYGWANDYREKKHMVPFITAGIAGGFSSGDGQTGPVFSIPVGAGAKWKTSPRTNIQLTCLFARTFGDKADGIKDPYGMGSSPIANSDWIGSLVLSITFDFKERCFDCNKE